MKMSCDFRNNDVINTCGHLLSSPKPFCVQPIFKPYVNVHNFPLSPMVVVSEYLLWFEHTRGENSFKNTPISQYVTTPALKKKRFGSRPKFILVFFIYWHPEIGIKIAKRDKGIRVKLCFQMRFLKCLLLLRLLKCWLGMLFILLKSKVLLMNSRRIRKCFMISTWCIIFLSCFIFKSGNKLLILHI